MSLFHASLESALLPCAILPHVLGFALLECPSIPSIVGVDLALDGLGYEVFHSEGWHASPAPLDPWRNRTFLGG